MICLEADEQEGSQTEDAGWRLQLVLFKNSSSESVSGVLTGVATEWWLLPGGAQGSDLDVDSTGMFTLWKLKKYGLPSLFTLF